MQKNEAVKTCASNRKAFHDYFVEERFEAGIELFGTEVKSIRQGTVNLKDSYLIIDDGELFAAPFGLAVDTVTGDTGRVLHDGATLADELIE